MDRGSLDTCPSSCERPEGGPRPLPAAHPWRDRRRGLARAFAPQV